MQPPEPSASGGFTRNSRASSRQMIPTTMSAPFECMARSNADTVTVKFR
jgi:hypothetical protein